MANRKKKKLNSRSSGLAAEEKKELRRFRSESEERREMNREKQAAFRERQTELGRVRLSVWVPKERAAELREIAHHMCNPDRKEKTPPVQVPVFEVSKKHPGWSYLRADIDEKWLHVLLKANGGRWQNAKKDHPNTWRIRSDLVAKLGLESRVVLTEEA